MIRKRETNELRVAVVHPEVREYRLPLFRRLAERYQATFYIFDESQRSLDRKDSDLDLRAVDPLDLITGLLSTDFDAVVNIDYVFPHASAVAMVAWLTDVPLVQWTETWDMPYPTRKARWIQPAVARGIGRVADTYVVPGAKAESYLRRHAKADSDAIFVAPNASPVPRDGVSGSIEAPSSEFTVLYVGRLVELKRVGDVIRAVARLAADGVDVALLVAGAGDERYEQQLKELAGTCDAPVHFLGWVDEEREALYRQADVCVLPSLWDAFPLAVTEAMNSGSPVIVSDGVGQAHDVVIDGQNGYVVPTKSPSAIYRRLSKLQSSPGELRRLSRNARETAEQKLTYDEMSAAFFAAIDEAVNSSADADSIQSGYSGDRADQSSER